jgi:hypothetical protein
MENIFPGRFASEPVQPAPSTTLAGKIYAAFFSYLFHPVFVPLYVSFFLVYLHPSARLAQCSHYQQCCTKGRIYKIARYA